MEASDIKAGKSYVGEDGITYSVEAIHAVGAFVSYTRPLEHKMPGGMTSCGYSHYVDLALFASKMVRPA